MTSGRSPTHLRAAEASASSPPIASTSVRQCGVRGTPLHALLSRTHCGNRAAAAVALEG